MVAARICNNPSARYPATPAHGAPAMRIIFACLLSFLALPALAQDDACGRASLEAMDQATPEKDPAMQAKMERLRASLWAGYEQCMDTLTRRQAREEAMGMKTFKSATAAVAEPQFPKVELGDRVATCSVVSSSGAPCIRKVSEKKGTGAPDEVVFANACINPIELLVLYADQSRGMATIKPGASSTLLCNGCGGVKSTESVCR